MNLFKQKNQRLTSISDIGWRTNKWDSLQMSLQTYYWFDKQLPVVRHNGRWWVVDTESGHLLSFKEYQRICGDADAEIDRTGKP